MSNNARERLLEVLHERLAYLTEWLNRMKHAQEKISYVQDIVERTEWELATLKGIPEDGEEFLPHDLSTIINSQMRGNEQIKSSYPWLPFYTIEATNSTASVTVSGTTDMYSYVSRATEIDEPKLQAWANKAVVEYRDIQEKQTRYEKVAEFLATFSPDRVMELETAYKAYKSAISTAGDRITAGIAMRNLLEHFKGDLFAKARIQPKENMKWETMAVRMARGGDGSVEHRELAKQETDWNSLQTRLSDVAKGQSAGLVADLDNIWTSLLDHLFTILGIVKGDQAEKSQ